MNPPAPVPRTATAALLGFLLLGALFTGVYSATAAAPRLDYADVDAGGGLGAGGRYLHVAAFGAVGGGPATNTHAVLRPGFLGQVNDPPRATSDQIARYPGVGVTTQLARLLANDVDPEGGPVKVVSIVSPSDAGGTLKTNGLWMTYTPPPSQPLSEEFRYVISDVEGDRAMGVVTFVVAPPRTLQSLNMAGLARQSGGDVRFDFTGNPSRWYRVEFAEDLAAPVWQFLDRRQADAEGLFSIVDAPRAAVRFYRAISE